MSEVGEVHVWWTSLDPAAPAPEILAQAISGDERARAERFRFDRDRLRFVAGRGILRVILGRYLRRRPSSLRLRYGPAGKPTLALEAGEEDIRFNVSHAGGLGLYAVTRGREIGADVERIVPAFALDDMVERCLTSREAAALRALDPEVRLAAFFRCWTRKEAYLKARGHGLTASLRSVEVSVGDAGSAAVPGLVGDPADASRWSLLDLSPGAGSVAAVAVEGRRPRVVRRDMSCVGCHGLEPADHGQGRFGDDVATFALDLRPDDSPGPGARIVVGHQLVSLAD
ncbi:MAG TPA: 4'-phosphopantetheinyl transferase superfamily protein [Candidatus Nitrosotalea sp.]|nr:4'-phosphopantetheinyl transferase superfamily protein [Candidatus Nitrosotalea sp.]